jgi:1-acyl-sn-glycerol-3-phosphate acyltransferase
MEIQDSKPLYQIPVYVKLFRCCFRPIFRGVFHILSNVIITGKDNIPERGPYLIAINHISIVEPPLVLAFWPIAPEAVGAVDIWTKPGQSTLAKLYGGIPVHRGNYDRRLLETMVKVLNTGRPILIAPEGGRSHSPGMRPGLPGVAYVVDKAKVPIVPVGIVGSTEDFLHRAVRGQRPKLEIRVGQSVRLPDIVEKGEMRKHALQTNTDRIMVEIAKLLPQEYQGVYEKFLNPTSEAA